MLDSTTVGRSGREEARAVQEIQYSPEERFVGTSDSDDGIAAARSYVSILDIMIR